MFAQAGQSFLDNMAAGHGQTIGSRILRPYQDFDTPWGKGPYWNTPTITELQAAQFDQTMASAKKHGLHPLFALGSSANFSPSVSGTPGRGSSPYGGTPSRAPAQPAKLTMAELLESQARRNKDDAQADYYRALAAKERQAPGGDPSASFGGPGVKVTALPQGGPIGRRPLVENPRVSVPAYVEEVGPYGRRRVKNPDLGLDEGGQLEYYYENLDDALRALQYYLDGSGRWERGGELLRKRPLWRRQ